MRTIFQQRMCIYNIHGILGGRHEHAERVLSCEEIHDLREKSTKQFHQVSLELLTLDYINFIWNYHPWSQGRGGKCQFDSRKRQIDDNSGFILDFHWFSSLGVGKTVDFQPLFPQFAGLPTDGIAIRPGPAEGPRRLVQPTARAIVRWRPPGWSGFSSGRPTIWSTE